MNERMIVDNKTGEIINRVAGLPDVKNARRFSDLAGPRPVAYNLKDHPELVGRQYLIKGVKYQTGEFGPFVILSGYFVTEAGELAEPATIITGAEDIIARVSVAAEKINAGEFVVCHINAADTSEGRRVFWLDD